MLILDSRAGKRRTHLREETIYHVYATWIMFGFGFDHHQTAWFAPQPDHRTWVAELQRCALRETVYGSHAIVVDKYRRELEYVVHSLRAGHRFIPPP
jgi:hypothetical protein